MCAYFLLFFLSTWMDIFWWWFNFFLHTSWFHSVCLFVRSSSHHYDVYELCRHTLFSPLERNSFRDACFRFSDKSIWKIKKSRLCYNPRIERWRQWRRWCWLDIGRPTVATYIHFDYAERMHTARIGIYMLLLYVSGGATMTAIFILPASIRTTNSRQEKHNIWLYFHSYQLATFWTTGVCVRTCGHTHNIHVLALF